MSMLRGRAQHQLAEIRADIAARQLVILIGARGTGKTFLADQLRSELSESGVQVLMLDASEAQSLDDINGPVLAAVGCGSEFLADCEPRDDLRLRIIVDNCEDIYRATWIGEFQDEWRAFLTNAHAEGRVSVLLLARPVFRNVLGGRGSPLMNIALARCVRPMMIDDLADGFGIDRDVSQAVLRKTGGHPALTIRLLKLAGNELSTFGNAYTKFVSEETSYLIRLVEDHTLAGQGVLSDLLSQKEPIAERTLIEHRFGQAAAQGKDCIDDLVGSGLVERLDEDLCAIGAQLLRDMGHIRTYIRVPEVRISIEPPEEQGPAGAILYELENRIRQTIADWLGAVDNAWWPARLDPETVGLAESRWRAEQRSQVPSGDETHPLLFLSLGELFTIMEGSDNWFQVFGVRLELTRERFQRLRDDVLAVRNKVAHSRPVNDRDLEVLRLAAGELGNAVQAE